VAGKATYGANIGRITKGMARSFIAECLLYCGSPLMNGVSTGNYTYHQEYMERAAEAAWKVIEMSDQGVYGLEDWATYKDIFAKFNRTHPGGKELIFGPPLSRDSRGLVGLVILQHFGGYRQYSCPTQNLVDRFEMANGLPYNDPESGYEDNKPWDNREPRFYFNILLNGERVVQSLNDQRAFTEFYVGGRDRATAHARTGYGQKKYTGLTTNRFDDGWSGGTWTYSVPRLRLAEIYLLYAEAVNEAYGPSGSHPGAGLTAIDAVNIVRERAQMPNIHSKFTGDKDTFRDRIWNERSVELAFEGKYWYDIRRWYVAHLPFYRDLYEMLYDENYTYFERYHYFTRNFETKHYWMPLPIDQVNLYTEWKQNPGW
jgi:starch-binding outer membrane protein, SusD/RagB family